jgi:hypothetical protein
MDCQLQWKRSLGRKEAGCICGHEQVPKLPYSALPAKVSSAHLASLHGAGVRWVGQREWKDPSGGGGHPTSGAFAVGWQQQLQRRQ